MWEKLSSKEIFSHPRLSLIEDKIKLHTGKETTYLRYKENSGGGVTIIARNEKNEILVSKEYSYPVNESLYQFPGGGLEVKEDPKQGGNRELQEETGYKANKLELIGEYFLNNRRSAKKMFIFLATELLVDPLPPDEEEIIENFWFSEKQIDEMIKNKKIVNVHFLAPWTLYKANK